MPGIDDEPVRKPAGVLTVSVGSSSKKAGKSSLASHLVRELGARFGMKVSSGGIHGEGGPVITERSVISRKGTDTGALMDAGAEQVIWVNSEPERLGEDLARAFSLLEGTGIAVIEGNSALGFFRPDYAVFLMSVPFREFKPSALSALPAADLVLINLSGRLEGSDTGRLEKEIKNRAPGAATLFFHDGPEQKAAWEEAVRLSKEALYLGSGLEL